MDDRNGGDESQPTPPHQRPSTHVIIRLHKKDRLSRETRRLRQSRDKGNTNYHSLARDQISSTQPRYGKSDTSQGGRVPYHLARGKYVIF